MLVDKLGGIPNNSLDGTDYSLRRTNNPSLYSTKVALVAVGNLVVVGGLAYLTAKGYKEYTFPAFTFTALIDIGFWIYHIIEQMHNGAHFLPR